MGDIGLTGADAVNYQQLIQQGLVDQEQVQANNFGNVLKTGAAIFSDLEQSNRDLLTTVAYQKTGSSPNYSATPVNTPAITSSGNPTQVSSTSNNQLYLYLGLGAIALFLFLKKG